MALRSHVYNTHVNVLRIQTKTPTDKKAKATSNASLDRDIGLLRDQLGQMLTRYVIL